MQIIWSNNTIYESEPNGGIRVANSVSTYDGWNVYVVDLGTIRLGPRTRVVRDRRLPEDRPHPVPGWTDPGRLGAALSPSTTRTCCARSSGLGLLGWSTSTSTTTPARGQRDTGPGGYGVYDGGAACDPVLLGSVRWRIRTRWTTTWAMRAAGSRSNPLAYSPGRTGLASAHPPLHVALGGRIERRLRRGPAERRVGHDRPRATSTSRTGLTGLSKRSTVTATAESGAGLLAPCLPYLGTSVACGGVGRPPVVYWMHGPRRGRKVPHRLGPLPGADLRAEPPGAPATCSNGSIARVVWKIGDETLENVSQDIVVNHRGRRQRLREDRGRHEDAGARDAAGRQSLDHGMGQRWRQPAPGIDGFRIDPSRVLASATSFAFRRVEARGLRACGSQLRDRVDLTPTPRPCPPTLHAGSPTTDQSGCDGLTIATGLAPSRSRRTPGRSRRASVTARPATSVHSS